jgi:hypothetical protein
MSMTIQFVWPVGALLTTARSGTSERPTQRRDGNRLLSIYDNVRIMFKKILRLVVLAVRSRLRVSKDLTETGIECRPSEGVGDPA